MTQLSYSALAEKLPAGAIEFVGNNQVKLNLSLLTESGASLNLDSSCIKGIIRLLQGLKNLTDSVNEARSAANQPPIYFTSQDLTGSPEQPEYEFTVRVKIDTAQFINNIDDPTD